MVRDGGFLVKQRQPNPLVRWANKAKAVLPLSWRRQKEGQIPKGYMAVYVGQDDGNFQRFMVPVVHFNHPLFGDLLKESENEYGFDQPGGLAIPCRVAEFERRIKTVERSQNKSLSRKFY